MSIKQWYYNRKNRQLYRSIIELLSNCIQIEIIGKRKSGKSALNVEIALAYHNEAAYKQAQDFDIEMLREVYGLPATVLEKYDTTVWSNMDIMLDAKRGIKNNYLNFSDFGLPNDVREVKYIPAYSLLIFDEVQGEASSIGKGWHEDQLLGAQFAGHNNYKFILASQRLGDVSAKFKELSDLFISIRGRAKVITDRKGVCKRMIIKTIIYSEQEDALRHTKPSVFKRSDIADRVCKYKKFVFYGNIFEHYNPRILRLVWLVGLAKHGYHQSKLPDLTIPDEPTVKNFERVFRCFSSKAYKEAQYKRIHEEIEREI